MYNLDGVNDIAFAFPGSYFTRVGGVSLWGDVNSGPFSLGVRYVTALTRFSVLDLPNRGPLPFTLPASSAEPWSFDIKAAFAYNWWTKNQNIYIGYGRSGETEALLLPRQRYLVGLGIDWTKNVNLGLEFARDVDFSASRGHGGDQSNLLGVRAGVKFG